MNLTLYRIRASEVATVLAFDDDEFDEWEDVLDWNDVPKHRPTLCIQKRWHALKVALTGLSELEPAPGTLTDVVLGGEELDIEGCYGAPLVLDPERDASLADELDELTDELIVANGRRVDFIAEVYPYHARVEQPDPRDLLPLVDVVRRWFRETASAGDRPRHHPELTAHPERTREPGRPVAGTRLLRDGDVISCGITRGRWRRGRHPDPRSAR